MSDEARPPRCVAWACSQMEWQFATHPGAACKALECVAPTRRVNGESAAAASPVRYRFDEVDGQLTTSNT